MSNKAITWAWHEKRCGGSSEKLVLLKLADCSNDYGESFPSIRTIATDTGLGERTVTEALGRLEEKGLIERERRYESFGRQKSNLYRLLMHQRSIFSEHEAPPQRVPEQAEIPQQREGADYAPSANPAPSGEGAESAGNGGEGAGFAPLPAGSAPLEPSDEPKENPPVGSPRRNSASKPKRRSRSPPPDFTVTDAMRAWAADHVPGVDIEFETAKFLDHEYATPRSDWPAAWRNWMRKATSDAKTQRTRQPDTRSAFERFEQSLGRGGGDLG